MELEASSLMISTHLTKIHSSNSQRSVFIIYGHLILMVTFPLNSADRELDQVMS